MRLTNWIMLNSFRIRAKFTNLSYDYNFIHMFFYYYYIVSVKTRVNIFEFRKIEFKDLEFSSTKLLSSI